MRLLRVFIPSFLVFCFLPAIVVSQKSEKPVSINYEEYKLKNGLTVILHQDKTLPIAGVSVFYRVGSKNETPGRTGFAHLFEHMMFQGSKNYRNGFLDAFGGVGGIFNGTTSEDRTYYFNVVPSNFLERTLYLEADRMGNLLDAITQAKLDNQRDVVKNERRLRIDNQPYGTMSERIGEIMYPEGHPYHWSVIGSMADLSAASLDDVRSFFSKYYAPNNAILILAGNFDKDRARGWIERYFAPIAKGGAISQPNPPARKLNGEVRRSYQDAVPFPRLAMVWHSAARYSENDAALEILASVLSGGRGSRLQSNLNYGNELVSQISASQNPNDLGGTFQISATVRPGKSLEEVEREIDREVEKIKKYPPTEDELSRAINLRESTFIFSLQSVLGRGAQLGEYAGYLGKPGYLQTDLDRYRKVTPADIQRVAGRYLTEDRLVVSYVPGKRTPVKPDEQTDNSSSGEATKVDRDLIAKQKDSLPKPGPTTNFSLPSIEKTKLSNGLKVWFVKKNILPIVSMNLVFNSGSIADPTEKFGVALWTASMLNQGTTTRSAAGISNQLQSIGASISADSGRDSSVVSLQTLTKNLDKTLGIYSDIIQNPSFPNAEIESLRSRQLIGITQRKSQPTGIAGFVFNKVLYGDQPYGRNTTEGSIKAINREDLVSFHKANYIPNNATLIVVGDVDSKSMLPKLESVFADWKAGAPAPVPSTAQSMKGKPGIYIVDKPGAVQSTIAVGVVGLDRSNPDYYAVQVMNHILGGGSLSRLNRVLREEKAYTYGAYSVFLFRKGPGTFRASGDFETGATKESVIELMKQIEGIGGSIPVTKEELETSKANLISRYPQDFETVEQIARHLSDMALFGLPETYFDNYIPRINAVTLADVNRVANKYVNPTKMAIVIVGDRKAIESKLRDLGHPISILDTEGNPIGR